MYSISYPVAFFAGIISFLSPCVIPLLPVYLGTITGTSLTELQKNNDRSVRVHTLIFSLIFVLGFSLVFVLLGLGASAFGHFLIQNREMLQRVSGVMLIIFGSLSLGFLNKVSFFQKELHLRVPKTILNIRYVGSFFLGVSFALVWTPCVGPILGGILTLAASSDTLTQGTLLLGVYALGIALPFLLIALFVSSSVTFIQALKPYFKYVHIIGGILLIIIGILFLTNQFVTLSGFFLRLVSDSKWYSNFLNYL